MNEIMNSEQKKTDEKDDTVIERPDLKKRRPFLLIGAIILLFVITGITIAVCVKSSGNKKSEYDKKIDLGRKYLSELNYEQAIMAFEEAINIDPKRDDAYILLAKTYVSEGDMDKAKAILDDAVEETKSDRARDIKRKIRKIKKTDDNNIDQVILLFEDIINDNANNDNNGITDNENEIKESIGDEDEDISNHEKYPDNADNTDIITTPDVGDHEEIILDSSYEEYNAVNRIIDLYASSTLVEENYDHGVYNIFDNNRERCWCEGVDGNGEGEYITIKFDDKICLSSISIFNGYSKDERSFNNNGKVENLRILYRDGDSEFFLNSLSWNSVKNKEYTDVITFDNPIFTDYLRIEIKEGISGAKYTDTCISKIGVTALGNDVDRNIDTGYIDNVFTGNQEQIDSNELELDKPFIELRSINDGTGVKIVISKTKGAEGYNIYLTERKNTYSTYFSFSDYLYKPYLQTLAEIVKAGSKEREFTIKGLPEGYYEFQVVAYRKDPTVDNEYDDYPDTIYSYSDVKGISINSAKTKEVDVASYDFRSVTAGETITFGHYEQDGIMIDGKEAIEWIVLSVENNELLLLSKNALDCLPFNNQGWVNTDWENCSLRQWLNNDFYNSAFDENEKGMIENSYLKNKDNPEYGTVGGNDTYDKVFILSYEDMINPAYGFNDDAAFEDEKRLCNTTPYARVQGTHYDGFYDGIGFYDKSEDAICRWWLRSPDSSGVGAVNVNCYGDIWNFGAVSYSNDFGVRPAIRIKMKTSSIDELSLKEQLKNVKVGDEVTLGSYEQDNDFSNGSEPIEWIVLGKDSNKVLLLSKYALDAVEYNKKDTTITWEDCYLRKWLNNDFYNTAFNNNEKSMIKTVKLRNPDNREFGISGGSDTKDDVFLLSVDDVINDAYGFSNDYGYDKSRCCAATKYAKAQGVWTCEDYIDYNEYWRLCVTDEGEATCSWWLRTPGDFPDTALAVGYNGGLDVMTNSSPDSAPYVDWKGPVRPAIYISLE